MTIQSERPMRLFNPSSAPAADAYEIVQLRTGNHVSRRTLNRVMSVLERLWEERKERLFYELIRMADHPEERIAWRDRDAVEGLRDLFQPDGGLSACQADVIIAAAHDLPRDVRLVDPESGYALPLWPR